MAVAQFEAEMGDSDRKRWRAIRSVALRAYETNVERGLVADEVSVDISLFEEVRQSPAGSMVVDGGGEVEIVQEGARDVAAGVESSFSPPLRRSNRSSAKKGKARADLDEANQSNGGSDGEEEVVVVGGVDDGDDDTEEVERIGWDVMKASPLSGTKDTEGLVVGITPRPQGIEKRKENLYLPFDAARHTLWQEEVRWASTFFFH